MIKNVVFDLGNVLVNFKPIEYMKELGFNDEMVDIISKMIFKSSLWIEADRGTLTIKELSDMLVEKNPSYKNEIMAFLSKDWVKVHTRKEDSINYLKELKQKGYNIYLLSNCSKEAYEYIMEYDFAKLINGGVYSYEINKCKPEEDIYLELIKKFNIQPQESIFLDDNKDNIEKSIQLGFHGVVFNELEQAKKEVDQIIANN